MHGLDSFTQSVQPHLTNILDVVFGFRKVLVSRNFIKFRTGLSVRQCTGLLVFQLVISNCFSRAQSFGSLKDYSFDAELVRNRSTKRDLQEGELSSGCQRSASFLWKPCALYISTSRVQNRAKSRPCHQHCQLFFCPVTRKHAECMLSTN